MTIYAFSLIYLLFGVVLCHEVHVTERYKKIIVVSGGVLLLLVAGLRFNVGMDYLQYMHNYHRYATESIQLLSNPGLSIVARLCSVTLNDYATWFFIMAVITIIPIIYVIVKYAEAPELSMLLFVLLGCWHFSFNLVKQCAAASFIFVGYNALIERKFRNWAICCLIATLFHITAVLMIPVYFLTSEKVTKRNTGLIVLIGVVVFLFYDRLFDVAYFLKQGEGIVSLYSATRNESVNILRVLVNLAPILLMIIYRNAIEFEDKRISPLVNMSLLNGALNIGAMNSIYLYRFCCYTNIFNILFIPVIIKRIKPRDRMLVIPIIIILYFVFWWYDLQKGSTTVVFHWIFER